MYGIYETAGCIASASDYGCGMYANTLEMFSPNTTSCGENIFRLIGTYMRYPFLCCDIPTKMSQKPFLLVIRV